MRKVVSSILIPILLLGSVHVSFWAENNDGLILDTDEEIGYFLNVKNNFSRNWKTIQGKTGGECNWDEYTKLMKKVWEEVIYKSEITNIKLKNPVETMREIREEINYFNKFWLDWKEHTEEEKIKVVSEVVSKVISKLLLSGITDKDKKKKFVDLLSPWIEEVVSESIQHKKGMIDLSDEGILDLVSNVLAKVLIWWIEKSNPDDLEDYADMYISILSYLNSEVGLLGEELKFWTKCTNEIFKTASNIEKSKKTNFQDAVFLLSRESAFYLLSNMYGIRPKIDLNLPVDTEEIKKEPKEYFVDLLKICSKDYDLVKPEWFLENVFSFATFSRIDYGEYLQKYCGVSLNIADNNEFEKYPFSSEELGAIARKNITNFLSIAWFSDTNERLFHAFLLSRLSKSLEYTYEKEEYKDLVKKNTVAIDAFLKKREKERLIDTNCDGIADMSGKARCIAVMSDGTLSEKIRYIQSNSGTLNTKPQNTTFKEEKSGFFQSLLDWFVWGIKSIYRKTVSFFKSDSSISTKKLEQKSVGKIETPNGKEYELISYGTGFHFKKSDGSLSQPYTSTGETQNYLNEQNPLITSDYADLLWKKYRISNYKGINIIAEDGKKIDKAFANNEEAIVYLDSLNPPTCDVTIKQLVNAWELSDRGAEPRNKKFVGNYRIVNFKTLWKCNWWKYFSNWNDWKSVPWINRNEYWYIDFLTFIGWFGWYPDEENPVVSSSKIDITNNKWLSGDINIQKFKDGTSDIRLFVWDTSLLYHGKWAATEQIVSDFKLIWKTLEISIEAPKFDWNAVSVNLYNENHSGFLSCMSNLWPDEFTQKFGSDNQNWFYAVDSQWLGKVLYIKWSDKFADCCRMWISCDFKSFDKSKNSIVINRTSFDNMEQKMISDETYFINVSNGKVTLKK